MKLVRPHSSLPNPKHNPISIPTAMESPRWVLKFVFVVGVFVAGASADAGEDDPLYRNCVEQCERLGYTGDIFSQHCQFLTENVSNRPWFMQEPLYLSWKQWNCKLDCSYSCMMKREKEREELGLAPVKYHGKWPFKRISVMQEPVPATLSVFNLIMHFNGWLSFFLLLQYKLPLRPQSGRTYYEYTGFWHIYGVLAMNAWFWSAIFHIQGCVLTERLEISAGIALLGCFLILTILRTFNVRTEASRVMIAAPLLAFLTTHILYMNFYKLDHGLNMKISVGMNVINLLLWAIWAALNHHPSKLRIWMLVLGSCVSAFLETRDFAPYKGYIDSHALWHAIAIPLTYLWWNFLKADAAFQTSVLIKKAR